jgi:hypothetical protein
MAVDIAPQRRDAVEILAAIEVNEEATTGRGDDEWLLGGICLHGRERMPNVLAVPLFELFTAESHAVTITTLH